MSLQVWLPLRKDANNLGMCSIKNINGFNNNIVKYDKRFNSPIFRNVWMNFKTKNLFENINKVKKFTMSFFIRLTNEASGWEIKLGNGTNFLNFIISSANPTYLTFHGTGLRTPTFLYDSEWHYLTIFVDDSKVSLYIDNVFQDTKTNTKIFPITEENIELKMTENRVICNLKIYDEIISLKQMKINSYELFLHYPLNQIDKAQNEYNNLVYEINPYNNFRSSGLLDIQVTKLDEKYRGHDIYRMTATTGNLNNQPSLRLHLQTIQHGHGIGIAPRLAFPPNTNKLISILYRLPNKDTDITMGCASNIGYFNTLSPIKIDDDWSMFGEYRLDTDSKTTKDSFFVAFSKKSIDSNQTVTIDFCMPFASNYLTKLIPEYNPLVQSQITKEYDTSGYKNNGTFNDKINLSENTLNYNYSYNMNKTGYIEVNNLAKYDQCSISMWLQCNTLPTAGLHQVLSDTGAEGNADKFSLIINSGSSLATMIINGESAETNEFSTALGRWYHLVFTFDRGKCTWYINGEKDKETTLGNGVKDIDLSTLFIGDKINCNCTLSDFRFYQSIIPEEHIKELFNIKTIVDNNQNILSYEFNETEVDKIDITSTGRVVTNAIYEDNEKAQLFRKKIKSKNIGEV
nr:MAG TPA: Concanavalin A-like lectin/glucanase superfamily protein [Caudoviricetes sp.]